MFILNVNSFCQETSIIWQFIGYILMIFKIVVPLLLIIFGIIDLGKAVVSNEDKAIKKSTSCFVRRVIATIVIFFIPTIVTFMFSIVGGFQEVENIYQECKSCVINPTGKACTNMIAHKL